MTENIDLVETQDDLARRHKDNRNAAGFGLLLASPYAFLAWLFGSAATTAGGYAVLLWTACVVCIGSGLWFLTLCCRPWVTDVTDFWADRGSN